MAETRKRLKWGRWLLLALVVLYFAPVIPYRYGFTACDPEPPAGDGECYGGNTDFEFTSVSAVVGAQFLLQARIIRNDEAWVGLNAEDDADRARVWLALTHTGFFYTRRQRQQIDQEEAWLWTERGEHARASRQFERIARSLVDDMSFESRSGSDWWQAMRTASLAGDRDRARALAEERLARLGDEDDDDRERRGLYRYMAYLARQSGNFEEALDLLDDAEAPEEFYEDNAMTTFDRAYVFAERYQQAASSADAERALELFAEGERLYGRYGENAGYLLRVWSEPMMMTGRAEFLSDLGRCEESAAVLDAAISRLPDDVSDEDRCSNDGVSLDEINLADARCRLLSMRGAPEADTVCEQHRAMLGRQLCYRWMERMVDPFEPTEPLACFVSGDGPGQGDAAGEGDRG